MSEPSPFPAAALERLAVHIGLGDVVFFIGAGFSVDSEGNTASRLIWRLLLRLLALIEEFELAELHLRDELKHTFDLAVPLESKTGGDPLPFKKADVDKLAYRYYETNEWFCDVFARVLRRLADVPEGDLKASAVRLAKIERRLRDHGSPPEAGSPAEVGAAGATTPERTPLDFPLQDEAELIRRLPALIAWVPRIAVTTGHGDAWRHAGKALFLDTLGFGDPAIMAGAPTEKDAREVARSYEARLLPRHHVLARFAREGLCTTTLTANYDLLLEGAFRLAGFGMARGEVADGELLPTTTFADFARIASPVTFFSDGKGHRTPVLVKMHGCADAYRDHRDDHLRPLRLLDYLPSMVFTYREIQNWRGDSWAADFLRTLLRTRTVVFAGYSLQDPVIHDTFRTVYEEMAGVAAAGGSAQAAAVAAAAAEAAAAAISDPTCPVGPERAPAFFFAPGQEKREFYGMEVLNAAGVAVGAPRATGDHPNYLRFEYRSSSVFPHVDELFLWLQHRVQRRHQTSCLQTHLRRTIALFLGRPRPLDEIDAVLRRFDELQARERRLADPSGPDGAAAAEPPLGRHEHGRLCGWIDDFHAGLLREFAAVDLLQQRRGPGPQLARLRQLPWYYPATQDTRWTCWGAVVEIAIRRMVRKALGDAVPPSTPDHEIVWCAQASVPTILFGPPGQAPRALAIYLAGFDTESRVARIRGQAVRHCSWQLTAGDALWSRDDGTVPRHALGPSHRVLMTVPPAGVIWNWASLPDDDAKLDPMIARGWLGWPLDSVTRAAG